MQPPLPTGSGVTDEPARKGYARQVFLEEKYDPLTYKYRAVYAGFIVEGREDVQVFTVDPRLGAALICAYSLSSSTQPFTFKYDYTAVDTVKTLRAITLSGPLPASAVPDQVAVRRISLNDFECRATIGPGKGVDTVVHTNDPLLVDALMDAFRMFAAQQPSNIDFAYESVGGINVLKRFEFKQKAEGAKLRSVNDELQEQIDAGKITFDPPASTTERLKKELLRENSGTKVTEKLQKLVLALAKAIDSGKSIRISSLIRNEGHHGTGRAVDIGNEDIADHLLNVKQIATDSKVQDLEIDEIIFKASGNTLQQQNRWNYDLGVRHDYDATTLADHANHIHFAVKE